jgi:hypothetical protein
MQYFKCVMEDKPHFLTSNELTSVICDILKTAEQQEQGKSSLRSAKYSNVCTQVLLSVLGQMSGMDIFCLRALLQEICPNWVRYAEFDSFAGVAGGILQSWGPAKTVGHPLRLSTSVICTDGHSNVTVVTVEFPVSGGGGAERLAKTVQFLEKCSTSSFPPETAQYSNYASETFCEILRFTLKDLFAKLFVSYPDMFPFIRVVPPRTVR